MPSYQGGRRALVDELGIEPGRALKELHQAILKQDRSLDLPGADAPAEDVDSVPPVAPEPSSESAARESRKTVTALFAKLLISSPTGASLDPEALRRVMGQAFDAVTSASERHGGSVETVTGDSITVVFSLPRVNEDDAWRAVRAAADMRKNLLGLADRLQQRVLRLAFGIGISTGEVVAGTAAERSLRASGEPLTRSTTLGFSAVPGEILFDDPTQRLVRHSVVAEPAQGAWRLLRIDDGERGYSGRLRSAMVGRDRERRQLSDVFELSVQHSSCHLATVLGAAGVGKSRLLQEFLGDLAGRALVARGRCLPYGEGITYWPLLEAVSDAVGFKDTDAPDVAAARIATSLGDRPDANAVSQALVEMIGLSERASGAEHGFAAATALFESWRESSRSCSRRRIHWGEPTSSISIEHSPSPPMT